MQDKIHMNLLIKSLKTQLQFNEAIPNGKIDLFHQLKDLKQAKLG